MKRTQKVEEVINIATINGVFSNSFQITGLDSLEARDLALLLRAGALAAPIYKVEERTVGPSLGQDNIDQGVRAFVIGFAVVAIFMTLYYKMFGFVANVGLLTNVILDHGPPVHDPGGAHPAGYCRHRADNGHGGGCQRAHHERIREELRNGMSPQARFTRATTRPSRPLLIPT